MQLTKRGAAAILFFAVSVMAAYRFRAEILSISFVGAAALLSCFALLPIHRKLCSLGIKESLAALISLFALLAAATVFVAVFVPYFASQIVAFVKNTLPNSVSALRQLIHIGEFRDIIFEGVGGDFESLSSSISYSMGLIARLSGCIAANAGRLIMIAVFTYYMLRENKVLANYAVMMIPIRHRRQVCKAAAGCRNAILGYFSGLMKTSLFVCLATYAALLITGIPDALLLAVFMGLLEVLPYFGPVLASVPIILSAIPLGTGRVLAVLSAILVIQQLEANIAGPYFTASSVSIHPFAAVAAVFVFGTLGGFWGILLAVPALVVLRSLSWSLYQMRIEA